MYYSFDVNFFLPFLILGNVPASFVREPKSIQVVEGKTGTMDCEVAGYPVPKVTWFRNGREILEGRKFKMTHIGNIHTLVINEVFEEDCGDIVVKVYNKGGTKTARASLQIQGKLTQFKDAL